MIQTVIFDIGRVLIGFEWKEYVHALFGDPAVEAQVTDATFGSGIWNEIYRILLENYELKAEECVFVDDNGKNIQAARELGFRTVHFENYEQAHEALEELLKSDGEADE